MACVGCGGGAAYDEIFCPGIVPYLFMHGKCLKYQPQFSHLFNSTLLNIFAYILPRITVSYPAITVIVALVVLSINQDPRIESQDTLWNVVSF